MQDTKIQIVKDSKYLGIQIDRHLTWKRNVDTVLKKVSRVVGLLKYAKNFFIVSFKKAYMLA